MRASGSRFMPFTAEVNVRGVGFIIGVDWRESLPAGKALGDLDWVGIWCVAVGADFGSGPFVVP